MPADLTWPMAANRKGSVGKREVVAGETAATVVTAVTSATASNEATADEIATVATAGETAVTAVTSVTASTLMLMANTTAVAAEHSDCRSEPWQPALAG